MISSVIVGNLCSDPDTRSVNGQSVTNFTIASNEKVNGEERATFVRVAIWGTRGEAFARYHRKGDLACVSGSQTTAKFRGRDGQEREQQELNCSNWTFVGGKKSDGGGQQRQAEAFAASDGYTGEDNAPF